MKTLLISCCILSVVLLSGCEEFKKENRDIADFFRKVAKSSTVDGTMLKYSATDTLKVAFMASEFNLNEPNADIILSGGETNEAYLIISYDEYKPGDATVQFNGSSLAISTKSGKPALISKIEGKLPKHTNLDLTSTSGDIRISNFFPTATIKTESTSGDISLQSCKAKAIIANAVSGNLNTSALSEVAILNLESTSGEIRIQNCNAANVTAETISGDLHLSGNRFDQIEGSTISGDIYIKQCQIKKRGFSSTSGEVVEE